jgi:outer membrane protein TolC
LTCIATFILWILAGFQLSAQDMPQSAPTEVPVELEQSASASDLGPPVTITLQDAMDRARKNQAQYLSAVTDAKVAHEDTVQARAALLPSVGFTQQYLNTQGNGKLPSGRYVTNDGVHVYRVWGVFHQEMPAGFFTFSPYHRAAAAAALAQAKAEIARRGLVVTVTKLYYGLIIAQRKYATAEQTLGQAHRFFDITQKLESGGEVARSDVIKAHLQLDQQKQAFQEAELAMSNAHLALAVLLFPNFNQHFTAVDDIDQAPVLPSFAELRAMAERENQDVRAALAALRQSRSEVAIARASFFPTLSLDADYGIEANALALRSRVAAAPQVGPVPNLGYFATATLNVPVWNWGSTLSKLRQAKYRRQQAQVELSQAQREALGNLYSFYNEAAVVRSEAATLREAADLAAESLRLTSLRYQAGEATVLEVVDAQNALTAARNAFDDGQARYRAALATLQTLTGTF